MNAQYRRRRAQVRWLSGMIVALALIAAGAAVPRANDENDEKPRLSLRATPNVSFSPARIFLTAELGGGPDDYEELYCASIEWDWGDGTKSESAYDCDPYEAGESEIRRRFTTEHVYRTAGNYRITLRLKQNDRVVTWANASVQVRPGLRDGGRF